MTDRVGYERQGTAFDPGACGHELQGRDGLLSPRALAMLQQMANAEEGSEDADLIVEGRRCMLGLVDVHRKTVNQLISVGAISRAYDGGPYWVINETGRAIARRPALAGEVFAAYLGGRGGLFDRE